MDESCKSTRASLGLSTGTTACFHLCIESNSCSTSHGKQFHPKHANSAFRHSHNQNFSVQIDCWVFKAIKAPQGWEWFSNTVQPSIINTTHPPKCRNSPSPEEHGVAVAADQAGCYMQPAPMMDSTRSQTKPSKVRLREWHWYTDQEGNQTHSWVSKITSLKPYTSSDPPGGYKAKP